MLTYIIVSSFLISLGVLLGTFALLLQKERTEKIILFLVSLSAGTLMGGAFLHLIPEGLGRVSDIAFFSLILVSFTLFFFLEKILHWRHCHEDDCEIHTFGHMNLIGNGIHNFIDGLIIAAAFLLDIRLGITTVIAIAFHAIPQEIGNFGVLLHAKFQLKKALVFNFLIALVMVVGGIAGYFLSFYIEGLTLYLLPLAAGGFIYISTSDLIPEIRKEKDVKKSLISFAFFLAGIAIMYLALFL